MATTGSTGRIEISVAEYLLLFTQFSKEEQLKIAAEIASKTFADRWTKMDANLPDTDDLSEDDIISEVRSVRYA